MATEKLSAITAAVAAVGNEVYGIASGVRKRFTVEGIAQVILGLASERTKQHNFNATALTALGADSVLNGGFATDTIWVKGTGWTIAANVASSDATQTGDSDLENAGNAPIAGQSYEIVYTVTGRTVGNVTAVVGAQEGTDRATNATFTETIVATNTDVLKIRADLNFDGDIDDVTMKVVNTSWDLDDNQVCSITLDHNILMDAPTNMVDGAEYVLHIYQDGTGSRLITWDATAFEWPGGTAPTLTTTLTTGHDIIRFVSDGTSMFGEATLNFS